MAKVSIPVGDLNPYVIAGPRADLLLGYRDFRIKPDLIPVYSSFKKTMLGWSMGIGLAAGSLLPVGLLTEIRYDFDFFPSYNDANGLIHNNAFDFWVGVAL